MFETLKTLIGTHKRILGAALAAVTLAVVLILTFAIMPSLAAPAEPATTNLNATFARIDGITGGTNAIKDRCETNAIPDTALNNQIVLDSFQTGLTENVALGGGGGSSTLASGAVVFSAGGGQWFTPQIEKIMSQGRRTTALFCMYSTPGPKAPAPVEMETYEYHICSFGGVNTTLQGSSVEDLFTLKCGQLIHTTYVYDSNGLRIGQYTFRWDFLTNSSF